MNKRDADQPRPPEPEATPEQPVSDTSTDWDEWMEKHGPRPTPVADIADAEGKYRP
jgi:hypothetical protein